MTIILLFSCIFSFCFCSYLTSSISECVGSPFCVIDFTTGYMKVVKYGLF